MLKLYKKIIRELSKIREILAVIVYGSFARGDYGPRSDIDLFIITKNPAKDEVEDAILNIKIERHIQPTIRSLNQLKKTDFGLLRNIFREGEIIFLREPLDINLPALLKIKPYVLISFNLTNLLQKEKTRFNTALYGVKKKNYIYKGMLDAVGGKRFGKGCFLVTEKEEKKIKEFFERYKIRSDKLRVWI